MKYTWLLCVLLLSGTSCEKTITLDVQEQAPKLVVDASIENGTLPIVVLSKSLNYFSSISPEELQSSFVHNAIVKVSDGTKTVTLKEITVTDDSSGYSSYYYTCNVSNPSGILLGKLNTSYQLIITTEDSQTYESNTTIPDPTKTCDSIWWKPAPNADDTSLCVMWGKFTDPKGLGNYVRYFTRINSLPFLPGLNSVFDDQFVDGTTYSLQFDMGWDKNSPEKPTGDVYGYAYRGDTVTLKYCNIDKASYSFWNTWEFAFQSYGNPFSSPVKVLGNINNNALGAFCGYAVQYKTVIIPK
ncbi:MAG TPA: DUF4249 domain-containing protein [Panacibacter sp.]|nr:DUF4249 domain-containing protein [Panacibacter sp.]HNP45142.1 DUF4249 domain-containing protein [Panacibacter sp.]